MGDKPGRVLGQRKDTADKEKWSGRWESNPRAQLSKANEMRHFAIDARLCAIGVRIFAL